MAQTQLADVIVPAEFTAYQVENSLVSTALFTSGVQSKLKIIERFNRPAITLVLANILQHRVETLRRPLCEFIQARDPLPRQCQTFVG